MSNCKRIRRELGAYLYDDLNLQERRLVSEHLARCTSCQYEIHSRKETLDLVNRAASPTSPAEQKPGPELTSSVLRRVEREALLGRPSGGWLGRVVRHFTESAYLPGPASYRPAVGLACAALLAGILLGVAGGYWRANITLSAKQEALVMLAQAKTDVLRKGDVKTAVRLQQLEFVLQDVGLLRGDGGSNDAEQWDRMREAEQKFLKGDYRAAFQQYSALAANYPKEDCSKFAQQMVAFIADEKLADPALAVKEYRKIASLDDRAEVRAEATFRCGENHFELGDCSAALQDLQAVTSRYPSSPYWGPSQILLGDICYDKLGDYGRALAYYAAYFKRYPEEFNSHPRHERALLLAENTSNNWEPIRLFVEVQRTNEKAALDRLLTRYGNSSLVQKVGLGGKPSSGSRLTLTSY